MGRWHRQISLFEQQVLTFIDLYEARFGNKLLTMEKLATGAIRKRLLFLATSVIDSLLPESTSDARLSCLRASSRRDKIGTNLSNLGWETYWKLLATPGLSCREIRIAAMSNFIFKNGLVDISISVVRLLAYLAIFFMSMIALVYTVFIFELWSMFTIDTHVGVVIFQVIYFMLLTIAMALICLSVVYAMFVNNILPLSTAYKFKRREKEFLGRGILYRIYE